MADVEGKQDFNMPDPLLKGDKPLVEVSGSSQAEHVCVWGKSEVLAISKMYGQEQGCNVWTCAIQRHMEVSCLHAPSHAVL